MENTTISALTELAKACELCARKFGFDDLNDVALADIAQKMTNASKAAFVDLEMEDHDIPLLVSTVHFLGSIGNGEPREKLLSSFSASLRILLRTNGYDKSLPDECETFLRSMNAGLQRSLARFESEAPARAVELKRQKQEQAKLESQRLVECLTSHSASGCTSESGQIPSHWVASTRYPGEWVDVDRLGPLKAARNDESVQAPAFTVDPKFPLQEFVCRVRWGHGEHAVTLESSRRGTPNAAFDDALRLVSHCPLEEPFRPSKVDFGQVPEEAKPSRLFMKNVVGVGIPRYVCTASWGEDFNESKSTTQRSSMREACAEIVQIVRARAAKVSNIQPVAMPADCAPTEPVDYPKLLKLMGFDRGNIKFERTDGKWVGVLSWYREDGRQQVAKAAAPADTKELAVKAAMDAARQSNADSEEMNWLQVAGTLLKAIKPPHLAIGIQYKDNTGYIASASWNDGSSHILRGRAGNTKLESVKNVCTELHSALQKKMELVSMLNPQRQATPETAKKVQSVIKEMAPMWSKERTTLMALKEQTPWQTRRLQELTGMIALGDPLRRNAIDPNLMGTLLKLVLTEALKSCLPNAVSMSREHQEIYMRALCAHDKPIAGTVAMPDGKFSAIVEKNGRNAHDVLADLVDLRLLNRKAEKRLTITDAGAELLQRSLRPGALATRFGETLLSAQTVKAAQY